MSKGDATFINSMQNAQKLITQSQNMTGTNASVDTFITSQQDEDELIQKLSLDDDYEDEDFKIYFDKQTLINHLNNLEDDNLFKINLLQEDEQNLEKFKR